MEWELNIPKIFHVYWGGSIIPYLRFMTIKTFMKYNPDWEIMFWYSGFPNNNMTWIGTEQRYELKCKDFTSELMSLPITKNSVDFSKFGLKNSMPEVHKSDFIRLCVLSLYGGLWSDMDILYFKSMNSLYFNTPEYKDIQTFYCNHNYGHSIGFLMGSKDNKFFEKLVKISRKSYVPTDYQSIGCRIYNDNFSTSESIEKITPAMNISMDVVYAHDASSFPDIIHDTKTNFTDQSIGLHWYGGSPLWREYMEQTNGGLIDVGNNVIGNLIRNEQ
jgi:hypothetical protein